MEKIITIQQNPEDAAAHYNQGNDLWQLKRYDEALACYDKAIALDPGYAKAHNNRGNALYQMRRYEEALESYDRAIALKPDNAGAYNNRGSALRELNHYENALESYGKAIALKPDFAEAYYNQSIILHVTRRYDEALASCDKAIALKPDMAAAYNTRGNVLMEMGLPDEACAAFRRAIALAPNNPSYHSNLAYYLHFHPGSMAETLGREHAQWYAHHAAPLAAGIKPHDNNPDPNRRLRIGYVSPNFARHPVGYFLLPLFEAHNRREVEIFCYSSVGFPDELTRRLRAKTDVWRDVASLSDEKLAECIREDKIDILVDLVAHMDKNRLMTFARKPAPVQVTYLAYCSTTGLTSIDYRLTDPYLDPPGRQEFYSEKSVRLETYWCYQPYEALPPVGNLPALANGFITFACLNNPCKITLPTMVTWRVLLQTVPNARLLLHINPGSFRRRIQSFFAEVGIDPARVEFIGFTPHSDYLKLHDRIDIGLDPFPYCGGTTTCDALWMGVPMVSLAGETAVSRAGLSILSTIGVPELVARTPEDYIRIAADLAGDIPRLSTLRSGLRTRMQQSPLVDAPRFAAHIEAAFRDMWRLWCADQAITNNR